MNLLVKNGDGTITMKTIGYIITVIATAILPILIWIFATGGAWANIRMKTEDNHQRISRLENHKEQQMGINAKILEKLDNLVGITNEIKEDLRELRNK